MKASDYPSKWLSNFLQADMWPAMSWVVAVD
jgi:hypothetical protein